MRRRTGWASSAAILAGLCLAVAADGARAAETGGEPSVTAAKAAAATAVRHASKTAELLAGGDAAGLGRQLQVMKSDPALAEADRERLLRETLLGLANLKTDPQTRREVAAFRTYASSTIVWRDEHGHPEPVLLYDVAAAARFAGRRWAETDARDEALSSLAAGDGAALAAYQAGDDAVRRGVSEAFELAPTTALSAQRESLMLALRDGAPGDALALVAADRLGDAALFKAILRDAGAATVVAAVRRLDAATLQGIEPVPLLAAAAQRPEAASAALLALGRRAAVDPDAAEALFAELGGRDGASAAAALARSGDGAIVDRLATVFGDSVDERTRRHALLGLRLSRGDRAADHLRRIAADESVPAPLRREVPAWLRD